MVLNALSVDVEDYYHVSGFERHISRDHWNDYESRVVVNTQRLLELFAAHQVQATFFVLGWVASRYPQLVRQIGSAGHEIGSHSYWHRLVYEQTPAEFREDLVRSRQAIEDAVGAPVTAYRAPSFSITRQSLWALYILAEEGFRIDSSIFPIVHDRYGIPDARPFVHQLQTSAGPMWEFPPSVLRAVGVNWPVSGGGYFRLYPAWLTCKCLARLNQRHGQPLMFYLHPWEIDADQPRLRAGSLAGRMRHYLNLGSTLGKLKTLLKNFRFGTISQAIAARHSEPLAGVAA
jgi:polysaccharide deacetylase family protein (PEP-CTERM system associated)